MPLKTIFTTRAGSGRFLQNHGGQNLRRRRQRLPAGAPRKRVWRSWENPSPFGALDPGDDDAAEDSVDGQARAGALAGLGDEVVHVVADRGEAHVELMPDFASPNDQPWAGVRSEITSISVGDGVTAVGRNAFRLCKQAASVSMGGSVAKLQNLAFYLYTILVFKRCVYP